MATFLFPPRRYHLGVAVNSLLLDELTGSRLLGIINILRGHPPLLLIEPSTVLVVVDVASNLLLRLLGVVDILHVLGDAE